MARPNISGTVTRERGRGNGCGKGKGKGREGKDFSGHPKDVPSSQFSINCVVTTVDFGPLLDHTGSMRGPDGPIRHIEGTIAMFMPTWRYVVCLTCVFHVSSGPVFFSGPVHKKRGQTLLGLAFVHI